MPLYAHNFAPRHILAGRVTCQEQTRMGRIAEIRVTEEKTDAELIQAVAAGDRAALGQLYSRHAAATAALGRQFKLGGDALSDVVHDVFMELWQKAGDFDPARGELRTWLAVRLRSRCIDRIRRESRRAALEEQHGDFLRPRVPTPPGTDVVQRNRLRAAVMALDHELREVTQRAYFDGATTFEISQSLNIPHGTGKFRIRRAREVLFIAMTEST
ncbi:MAG: sigma-70 family RNA polymerase sigma factor [bacterium]